MKTKGLSILLLTLVFFGCNQRIENTEIETIPEQEPSLTIEKNPDILKEDNQHLKRDTLQYLEEGENEDNLFSMFLTKKFDTINIVLQENQNLDKSFKNKMLLAEWELDTMTSGGDSEVKYEQAFMKNFTEINAKTFR